MHGSRAILLGTALLVASVVSGVAAGPAQALGLYVALGDSYTAGPLVPNPKGDPIDCGQSDHNYPTLTANAIRPARFRDVSCGSAQTKHMTEPQTELPLGGTNPPQFNGLSRDAELVTLGIGGNDMGFGGIVNNCAELGIRSGGQGKPCTDHYTAGGRDQIAERLENVVAPRVAAVIEGIHQRSPNARLLVVGYPDPLPPPPGCFPLLPVAPGDLPYLHAVARKLHEVEKRVAEAGGAEYVELLAGSAGHDFCQPPGTKWYEGIVLTSPAYPAHPNALGLEFAARQVLAVLRQPVPNDFKVLSLAVGRRGQLALRLQAPHRGSFRVTATRTIRNRRARSARVVAYASGAAFAARAGEVALRLTPTRAARRALRRARRLTTRLRFTFAPVAGTPRTQSRILRVRYRR